MFLGKSKNQGGNIILRPKGGNITLRPKCFGINVKNQGNVRLIILFKSRKKILFFHSSLYCLRRSFL